MNNFKEKLNELLLTAARQSASDLHIGVGRRPTLRIDGVLIPLQKEQILIPEISEGLILSLLTEEQKKIFYQERQLDFSYSFEDKARFRDRKSTRLNSSH